MAAEKNIPEIRFKGFEGEWEQMTIGDIGSFYYGKSAPKWSLRDDAPTPCVRYGELYTKYGATITKTYSRTNIDPQKLRFSKGGEILVPRVGEKPEDFGKCCCYLPLKNIAIGEMISVFETTQNPLFYTYYFRNLYRQFAKAVEGKNVKNLYYIELEPISICRLSISEQTQIGTYFQNLDSLISLHQRKYDKLLTVKKAMLEKMFPKEGADVPEVRFKGFEGKWEKKFLGDEVIFFSGLTYSPSSVVKTGGTFVLRSSNVKNGEVVEADNVYVDSEVVNCDNVVVGDIIVVVRNGSRSLIGKHAQIKRQMDNTVIGAFMTGIHSKQPAFINSLLDTNQFNKEVEKNLGATINQITTGAFKKMEFLFPIEDEQTKIGTFFQNLDTLISQHQKQLEKLKNLKKACLEKMFV